MKLIVNADDFGYSRGVNLGVIDAYRHGILTSATAMVNMPGFAHAVELAGQHPGLGVGIHLVLTCGVPVLSDVPSLVDEQGRFHKLREIFQYATAADIEREFAAQIERFLAAGLQPTHLDSHHHVHAHELVRPVVLRLAERYRLPVRRFTASSEEEDAYRAVRTTDAFFWDFYGEGATVETMERLLQQGMAYETVEIMCHPAYVDEPLLAGSSYALPRARELAILTDERVKRAAAQARIERITYKEIS
ncbi:chitin disaccharide deacetylase [Brevibacillus sp. SYP-B805]|uniref:chitin disaccharide deacetylase n=1 Tax=Brevibacillus sp. SYP-B805 TaxID=1578199 RepID=UPI0013ED9E66|nr:chitin disaccharide deacetylase [Brevibacillus sp. SYP-B805]NGQ97346.1 chitin disaccharide deacetylase [Brevibacillus sp. SYP-B805]